jgi:nicotinamide riboside transporter PnuC
MVQGKGRRGGVKSMLVEPYVQVKLGLIFIIINLVFSILIFSVAGWYVWDVFNAISTYFQLSGQQSSLAFAKLQTPLTIIAILVLGFIATTLYFAVSYTHKFYGPMISINRFLDDVLEGRKPKLLALREGDQLQDLAIKLNQLVDKGRV